ncbi:unnamed protein product [Periconia digitata]|uniref:Uncharacterized protein n=1 Tax=Periconia digitata TaxID=1303443 RepID=A0A9W4U826_9PLEO|nr:unnamed protein product [Periconia digitata]
MLPFLGHEIAVSGPAVHTCRCVSLDLLHILLSRTHFGQVFLAITQRRSLYLPFPIAGIHVHLKLSVGSASFYPRTALVFIRRSTIYSDELFNFLKLLRLSLSVTSTVSNRTAYLPTCDRDPSSTFSLLLNLLMLNLLMLNLLMLNLLMLNLLMLNLLLLNLRSLLQAGRRMRIPQMNPRLRPRKRWYGTHRTHARDTSVSSSGPEIRQRQRRRSISPAERRRCHRGPGSRAPSIHLGRGCWSRENIPETADGWIGAVDAAYVGISGYDGRSLASSRWCWW